MVNAGNDLVYILVLDIRPVGEEMSFSNVVNVFHSLSECKRAIARANPDIALHWKEPEEQLYATHTVSSLFQNSLGDWLWWDIQHFKFGKITDDMKMWHWT